jgi:DNA/RNA endonuclease YhcR with UshA esterase domain
MQEKTLLKISLITALIGIFILLIILDRIDISDSNINLINKTMIDQQIKIKGEITRLTETPGLYILNVKDDTGNIDVIIFKEEKIELEKGKVIEIQGTVTEYQGKVEIIAKKIIIL